MKWYSFIPELPLNAFAAMLVTVDGITNLDIIVLAANIYSVIAVSGGNAALTIEKSLKEFAPIAVTCFGKDISHKERMFLKTPSPIDVQDDGIVICLIEYEAYSALFPIDVMVFGIVIVSNKKLL